MPWKKKPSPHHASDTPQGESSAPLASHLDSTLLRPDADDGDITRLARHAADAGCAAVCVTPPRLSAARRAVEGSTTRLATVIAFPSGACTSSSKSFETLEAMRLGAEELDIVVDLDAVRRGDVGALEREMGQLMERTPEATHKFIVEVEWLPAKAWPRLGKALRRLGPAFVKTGTGVNAGAVTVEQVARLFEAVQGEIAIKAAGGIRDLSTARQLLAAGAVRLGTSHAAALLEAVADERNPVSS